MFENSNNFSYRVIGVSLNVVVQASIILFVVGVAIWAVLFTTYAPIHDHFHALRHSLFIVPCH